MKASSSSSTRRVLRETTNIPQSTTTGSLKHQHQQQRRAVATVGESVIATQIDYETLSLLQRKQPRVYDVLVELDSVARRQTSELQAKQTELCECLRAGQDLLEQLDLVKERCAELSAELESAQAAAADGRHGIQTAAEVQRAREQSQQSQLRQRELERKLRDAEQRKAELAGELAQRDGEMHRLSAELRRVRGEKERLEEALNAEQASSCAVEERFQKQREKLLEARKRAEADQSSVVAEATAEMTRAQQSNERLREKIALVEAQLEEAKRGYEQDLRKVELEGQKKYHIAIAERDAVRRELKEQQQEHSRREGAFKSSEERQQAALSQLRSENTSLEQKVKLLTNSNTALAGEVQDLQGALHKVRDGSLDPLTKENDELKKKLHEHAAEIQRLQAAQQKLEGELTGSRSLVETQRHEISSLTEARGSAEEELNALRKECHLMREDNDSLQDAVATLEQQLSARESDVQSLHAQKEDKRIAESLRQQIEALRQDNLRLESAEAESKDKLDAAHATIRQLEEDLSASHNEKRAAVSEFEECQRELSKARELVQTEQQLWGKRSAHVSEYTEGVKRELLYVSEESKKLRQLLEEATSEKERLRAKADALSSEKLQAEEALQAAVDSSKAAQQQQQQSWSEKEERLQRRLDTACEERDRATHEVWQLKATLEEWKMNAEKEAWDSQLIQSEYQQQLENSDRQIVALQEKAALLTDQLISANEELGKARRDLSKAQHEFDSSRALMVPAQNVAGIREDALLLEEHVDRLTKQASLTERHVLHTATLSARSWNRFSASLQQTMTALTSAAAPCDSSCGREDSSDVAAARQQISSELAALASSLCEAVEAAIQQQVREWKALQADINFTNTGTRMLEERVPANEKHSSGSGASRDPSAYLLDVAAHGREAVRLCVAVLHAARKEKQDLEAAHSKAMAVMEAQHEDACAALRHEATLKEDQLAQLQESMLHTVQSCEHLRNKSGQLSARVADAESRLAEALRELREARDAAERQEAAHTHTVVEWSDKHAAAQKQLHDCRVALQQAQEECERLRRSNTSCNSAGKGEAAALAQSRAENEQLRAQLVELKEEVNGIRGALQEEETRRRSGGESWQKAKESLIRENAELQQQLRESNARHDELRRAQSLKQKEARDAYELLVQSTSADRKELDALRKLNTALEGRLADLEEDRAPLHQKVKDLLSFGGK